MKRFLKTMGCLLLLCLLTARKVIILDVTTLDPLASIGIASIILALSFGYYLLKKILNGKG